MTILVSNKSIANDGVALNCGCYDNNGFVRDQDSHSTISYDMLPTIHSFKKQQSILQYTGRPVKPANGYFRWYLLLALILVVFLGSPAWFPAIPHFHNFSLEAVALVQILLQFIWLQATFHALRSIVRLRRYPSHSIKLPKVSETGIEIRHIVGICIYKEPYELLAQTLNSTASQPNAASKISVVVGMEEGTPYKEKMIAQLQREYCSKFERFFVTVHPKGLEGDIAGKCSNFNYAVRTAVSLLRADPDHVLGQPSKRVETFITTADCDTIFGVRYFDAMEEDYWSISETERAHSLWQSPLFYCMNSTKSPFFVRVTGLLRAYFMMGFLIPWNINTMSIYSLTLRLYEGGDYTHPGYQMEDIIAYIRFSLASRRKCHIRLVPVATLSGPTSGTNYLNELYEWGRQIRRWTIGAAEVFHYFMIKSTRLPVHVSITFAMKFIFYYVFLLCAATIYSIIAPIMTPLFMQWYGYSATGFLFKEQSYFTYAMLAVLILQYLQFAFIFIVNILVQDVLPQGKADHTGIFVNLFHYIMTLPTILMYCLVELFAFFEVAIRGKAVCSHSAAKKDSLQVTASNDIFKV